MLRLPHKIFSQPMSVPNLNVIPHADEYIRWQQAVADEQREIMKKSSAPVIVADNVADYYGEHTKQEWDLTDDKDFPNIVPPFPQFFIVWRPPTRLVMTDRVVTREEQESYGTKEYGWWFNEVPPMLSVKALERAGLPVTEKYVADVRRAKFCLIASELMNQHNKAAWMGNTVGLLSDEYGKVITAWEIINPIMRAIAPDYQGQKHIHVAMLALGLMQCKNVAQVDVSETEGPGRKWCRRQKVPELKYHVLQINPNLSGKPRRESEPDGLDRSGKALHICRGHFRTYKEDGPGLFGTGRYGTFWVPSHKRGNAVHGHVLKDYSVLPPTPAAA